MNVKVLKQLRQFALKVVGITYEIDELRRPSYIVSVRPDYFPITLSKQFGKYFCCLKDAQEELKKHRRYLILRELDRLKIAKKTEQEHLSDL